MQNQSEKNAEINYSLCVLDNAGLVQKSGQDAYVITETAKSKLDALVKQHNGNRSLACTQMVLETVALGKEKALTIGMIDVQWRTLHFVAFGEKPSDSDVSDSECDGNCALCDDIYCPAKDDELDELSNADKDTRGEK